MTQPVLLLSTADTELLAARGSGALYRTANPARVAPPAGHAGALANDRHHRCRRERWNLAAPGSAPWSKPPPH